MENDIDDYYKLESQMCFPLYAASRLVTKCYQPILDELEITYPQYLVLMVLWENDLVNLSFLSEKLVLQSNTLSPLLKRMQEGGLVEKIRSQDDERNIVITLTAKGKNLRTFAPKLHERLNSNLGLTSQEAIQLRELLKKLLSEISY